MMPSFFDRTAKLLMIGKTHRNRKYFIIGNCSIGKSQQLAPDELLAVVYFELLKQNNGVQYCLSL